MDKIQIVAIVGPTGVGKTELSISLAERLSGEIISADSMQIYKYMDIGTAKPTKEEMRDIPHHLINVVDPSVKFDVCLFCDMAKDAVQKIHTRGNLPMLVGGTGLYVDSFLEGRIFSDAIKDEEYRKFLEKEALTKGNEHIHKMLKDIDIKSYENIHPNNVKRVIRALEVYHVTGHSISSQNEKSKPETSPYQSVIIGFTRYRDNLYDRIEKRIDKMIECGLANEVKSLYNKGYRKDLTSMQGLGYKELFYYFDGLTTFDEAVRILKRDTRHYAKRQMTWFNKNKDINWINLDDFSKNDDVLDICIDYIKNGGIKI